MKNSTLSPRDLAYRSLEKCENYDRYSNIEVDSILARHPLKPEDRGLYTTLVYGVIERSITLDYLIDLYAKKPKIDLPVRILLRLGIYQLLYTDRIPDHAVCSETVELAKRYASRGAEGFVNAILRKIIRERDAYQRKPGDTVLASFPLPDRDAEPLKWLSISYGFPQPICGIFLPAFGMERTVTLLEAYNARTAESLRVNTLKISREGYLSALREQGIAAEASALCEGGIRLERSVPVTALPGFNEGLCFVQDEASQLAVEWLAPREGETVLDICACPGGKSFSAGILMENSGTLRSYDLHQNKLSLVEKGAARLGIDIITTEAKDGRRRDEGLLASADRIICDVPCSGLGVMAKKPDLRYKKVDDIARLPQIQREILDNVSAYLKPGGRLLYSTCTVLKEENEQVVEAFLQAHPDFSLLRQRTLYPDTDGTDGFFVSVLERK